MIAEPHIGELYSFALDARARLDEAASYLDTFEKKLENLDSVRMMNDGVGEAVDA